MASCFRLSLLGVCAAAGTALALLVGLKTTPADIRMPSAWQDRLARYAPALAEREPLVSTVECAAEADRHLLHVSQDERAGQPMRACDPAGWDSLSIPRSHPPAEAPEELPLSGLVPQSRPTLGDGFTFTDQHVTEVTTSVTGGAGCTIVVGRDDMPLENPTPGGGIDGPVISRQEPTPQVIVVVRPRNATASPGCEQLRWAARDGGQQR